MNMLPLEDDIGSVKNRRRNVVMRSFNSIHDHPPGGNWRRQSTLALDVFHDVFWRTDLPLTKLNKVLAVCREILHRLVVHVNARRCAINAHVGERWRKEFNHKRVAPCGRLIQVESYSARVLVLSILSHQKFVSVLVQGMRSLRKLHDSENRDVRF